MHVHANYAGLQLHVRMYNIANVIDGFELYWSIPCLLYGSSIYLILSVQLNVRNHVVLSGNYEHLFYFRLYCKFPSIGGGLGLKL